MGEDIWALWPNSYMCPRSEIEQTINAGYGDDYCLVNVIGYDETSMPSQWKDYCEPGLGD